MVFILNKNDQRLKECLMLLELHLIVQLTVKFIDVFSYVFDLSVLLPLVNFVAP